MNVIIKIMIMSSAFTMAFIIIGFITFAIIDTYILYDMIY